MTDVSVDWERLRTNLVAGAVAGLNDTIKFATERAKYHAPVRHVFDANRSRNPRGKPFIGRVRNWTAGDYKRFTKSKRHNFLVAGDRGNIASLQPNIRLRRGTRLTGDFRSFRSGKLADVEATRQTRGGRVTHPTMSGNEFLSTRGRYEAKIAARQGETLLGPRERRAYQADRKSRGLKTYRMSALFRDPSPPLGLKQGVRLGGRLRGEIYAELASPTHSRGGTIWGYVVSPTEYAIHQEYGTRHNRAQPFMRPALYESRNELRLRVGAKTGKPSSKMARALTKVG